MPDTPAPLSPEQVDAMRSSRATNGLPLPTEKLLDQLLETVRDREWQRDESLALNRQGVCTYCGHVETIPEGEDRTEGIRRIMVAHIENCPQHPLKRIAEIVEPLQKERDELQRQNFINLQVAENALKSEKELQRQLEAARKASLDAERRLKAVPESLLCDQRDPCSYDHTCRIHKALAELRRIAGGENG